MPLATVEELAALVGLALTQPTSEPLKAGQPVFVGTDGTLYLSSAAAGAGRAIVDGFARTDAIIGAQCSLEDRALTLPDWSAVIGAASLAPGTRYYLAPQAGKLVPAAPSGTGQAVIRVGVALNAQTLKIKITDMTGSGGTTSPILQSLGLASFAAVAGTSFTAAITGQTAGSTIAATSSDGTVLAAANGQVSGTFAAAGSPTVTLTETLAGATGSPKSTALAVTVSASAPDTTITTDLSNPDRGLNPLV